MRLERVESVNQLKTGDSVVCVIDGEPVTDCKVFVAGKTQSPYVSFFLCQNEREGNPCEDKDRMGYEHSWEVSINPDNEAPFDLRMADYDVVGFRRLVKGAPDAAQ